MLNHLQLYLKMKKLLTSILAIAATACSMQAMAQDEEGGFEFGASLDYQTRYLWRGSVSCNGNMQADVNASFGGFFADVWGMTDFKKGSYSEIDITLGYSYSAFSLSLTAYCWTSESFDETTFESKSEFKYFDKYKETHYLELGLGVDFSEWFENVGLAFSANTMIAGASRNEDDKNTFSTFLGLDYEYGLLDDALTLGAGVGSSIENSGDWNFYSEDGFKVIDLHLNAGYDFSINDMFSIGLNAMFMYNPVDDKPYVNAGVGVSF